MTRALLWVGLLALAGCASPIVELSFPEAADYRVKRVAVVPFALGHPLSGNAHAIAFGSEAASRITRAVYNELEKHGPQFELIGPAMIRQAIPDPLMLAGSPELLGSQLADAFGVDALLLGTLLRFVPRQGSEQPWVRLETELRLANGTLLWWAGYEKREGDSAEQLARRGAEALGAALAEASEAWK